MNHNKIVLFKYVPFISRDGTLNDAKKYLDCYSDQKVWLTPVSEFNDPFEGRFRLDPIPSELLSESPDYVNSLREKYNKLHRTFLTYEEYINLYKSSVRKNDPSLQIEKLFSQHGVLCLTSCASNIPMWAHYGNNHSGYCLIFEFNYDFINEYLSKKYSDLTLVEKEQYQFL